MTSVGDVVASLQAVAHSLDEAATLAQRAHADLARSADRFAEVVRGTTDPDMRKAAFYSREAAAKTGKVARLYVEAADAYLSYVARITGGGMASQRPVVGGPASGGEFVARVSDTRSRLARLNRALASRADDLEDVDRSLVSSQHKAMKALRERLGPPSIVPPGPPASADPRQPAFNRTAGPPAEGSVLVAVSVLWLAGQVVSQRLRRAFQRRRE